MKELSIEEKAKAYDEALKKARNIVNSINVGLIGKDSFEAVFPELKESEDERVRKALIEYFRWNVQQILNDFDNKKVLAWLEKQAQKPNPVLDIEIPFGAKDSELQEVSYYIPEGFHAEIDGNKVVIKSGEQKPTAWSEEDESLCMQIEGILSVCRTKNLLSFDLYKKMCDLLKSLKDRVQPKQEWSEEDKRKIDRIYSILRQASDTHAFSTSCRLIGDKECIELQDFLKSLIPQSQWRPSDEQMECLSDAIKHYNSLGSPASKLKELLEDLKKL